MVLTSMSSPKPAFAIFRMASLVSTACARQTATHRARAPAIALGRLIMLEVYLVSDPQRNAIKPSLLHAVLERLRAGPGMPLRPVIPLPENSTAESCFGWGKMQENYTPSPQPEQCLVLLRQVRRTHGAGNEDMAGVAHGQPAIVFRQTHFVGESHHPRGGFLNPRPDDHYVVEAGGIAVLAVRFGNRQEYAVLHCHVPVVEAPGFAEFHAPHFHPNQVIRVVDHAHLVGFGVADA